MSCPDVAANRRGCANRRWQNFLDAKNGTGHRARSSDGTRKPSRSTDVSTNRGSS